MKMRWLRHRLRHRPQHRRRRRHPHQNQPLVKVQRRGRGQRSNRSQRRILAHGRPEGLIQGEECYVAGGHCLLSFFAALHNTHTLRALGMAPGRGLFVRKLGATLSAGERTGFRFGIVRPTKGDDPMSRRSKVMIRCRIAKVCKRQSQRIRTLSKQICGHSLGCSSNVRRRPRLRAHRGGR